jgi:aminocarboxymuconate-semialdehyde decarboxylase
MGPERLLFGTDSPPLATPLEDHLAQVRALPVSETDQEKILGRNARALFALG